MIAKTDEKTDWDKRGEDRMRKEVILSDIRLDEVHVVDLKTDKPILKNTSFVVVLKGEGVIVEATISPEIKHAIMKVQFKESSIT
jgi:hypothetical protein